jgi:hypothetical protein
MRRVAIVVALGVTLVMPGAVALAGSPQSGNCPDGWTRKTELDDQGPSVTFDRSGPHCVKWSTQNSGIFIASKGYVFTTPDGEDISYFVCYPKD